MDDLIGVTNEFTAEMAVAAYRQGIFPMALPQHGVYTWHRPDPRAIIPLDRFHISRSLHKTLRKGTFEITFDQDFLGVMQGCAEGRPVWIGPKFFSVYGALHERGQAHSVEVWEHGQLVGGTYGVHLGGLFCAESKFHRVTDASKVALVGLVERLRGRGFAMLEVQYLSPHLQRLGAQSISLKAYLQQLPRVLELDCGFT